MQCFSIMNWKSLLSSLRLQTSHLTQNIFSELEQNEYLLQYPEKLIFSIKEGPLKGFLQENQNGFEKSYQSFEWFQKKNANYTYWGHEHYPNEFKLLKDPPLFLSYLGSPCWIDSTKLSIVGSRYPSLKSFTWMEQNISNVVSSKVVIVSGAARGIDQKAHSLSIRQKQPTIAFIPSGLNKIYPQMFEDWIQEIKQCGGAIVSEYAPQQTMMKHHFLERNRMIAILGKCILVVEARRRSGSLMTSRLAIDEGQTVCVVPSFPDDLGYQGSIDLLFQGAFPIRDFTDLNILMGLS